MLEIEKAKVIYKAKSDAQLLRFFEKNADSLRVEILPVLIAELQRRNIGGVAVEQIENEIDLISDEKVEQWQKIIESRPCPSCNNSKVEIICLTQRTVLSFVLRTIYFKNTFVCCEKCKWKNFLISNVINFFGGWWSIKGILATPYALLSNFRVYFGNSKAKQENMHGFITRNYYDLEQCQQEEQLNVFLKKGEESESVTSF